jgi:hypothetical protein
MASQVDHPEWTTLNLSSAPGFGGGFESERVGQGLCERERDLGALTIESASRVLTLRVSGQKTQRGTQRWQDGECFFFFFFFITLNPRFERYRSL